MRIIYLLTLHGRHYAVWKDEAEAVRKIESIHRLPFSPAGIVGLASIDKQSTALADLAALLGLSPFAPGGPARLLLVAGQRKDAGFVFNGELIEVSIREETVLPMPAYLATPEISSCLVYQQKPLPLINLQALYQHLKSGDLAPSPPSLPLPAKARLAAEITAIRMCSAGREVFAFPAATVVRSFAKPREIMGIPLAPSFLKGIIAVDNAIIPVIDLAERMNLPRRGAAENLLLLNLAGENFAFLVDHDRGELPEKDFQRRAMPALVQSSLLTDVVIHNQHLIPLLNPRALIAAAPLQPDRSAPAADHDRPDSDFARQFNHEQVTVVEFLLLGNRHALPKNEVTEILPLASFRRLPTRQSLVIGIIDYQDEILPVLDLALVFGRSSRITRGWRMILLNNGDFRAFVVTEKTFPERELPQNIQKKIPLSLPHQLVYGCYPDGQIVRLILNVKAMTVNFDKVIVKEFFSALPPEAGAEPQGFEAEISRGEPPLLSEPPAPTHHEPPAAEGQRRAEAESRPASPPEPPEQPDEVIVLEQLLRLAASPDLAGPPPRSDLAEPAGAPGPTPAPASSSSAPGAIALARCLSEKPERLAAAEPIPSAREGGALRPEPGAEDEPALGEAVGFAPEHARPARATPGEISPPAQLIPPETAAEKLTAGAPRSTAGQEGDAQALIASADIRRRQAAELAARQRQSAAANDRARGREILARQKQQEDALRAERIRFRVERETKIGSDIPTLRRRREEPQRPEERRLAEAEEIARIGTGRWRRTSAQERARVLDEFRDRKKKGPRADIRLRVLLTLLFLLLFDILIFFGLPDRPPRPPRTISALSPSIAPAPAPAAEPPVVPARNPPAPTIDQPPVVRAAKEERPPRTIIVPDNIPLTSRIYRVEKGDNLWNISNRFTGDPYNYPFVAEDNAIDNPNLIFPGQQIRLQRQDREGARPPRPAAGL
jgi:chemotaxis signal transduction protein/nucleoid-associated protein YgaU